MAAPRSSAARIGWLAFAPLGLAFVLLGSRPACADWSRQTTRSLQQTTLQTSEQRTYPQASFTAVAATGLQASAPLIEQGQWNPAAVLSPAQSGGTFSLLLTHEAADGPPSLQRSVAPNRLDGRLLPDGRLQAGPGASASEVQLTVTQTYSVF